MDGIIADATLDDIAAANVVDEVLPRISVEMVARNATENFFRAGGRLVGPVDRHRVVEEEMGNRLRILRVVRDNCLMEDAEVDCIARNVHQLVGGTVVKNAESANCSSGDRAVRNREVAVKDDHVRAILHAERGGTAA